ncbi:MAG: class I SAM-dependent methyltransferase [Candidatus Goldiibacteriota bacterium]
MEQENKRQQWEQTQLQWSDRDFLENKANALMKKRWKRLELTAASMIEKEDVKNNELVKVLDIGAGRGEFYRCIKDIVRQYTGVEPSAEMLENEIFEDDFIMLKGSGETMEFREEFNICIIKEVLDHCYDPVKVIENSRQALKPGGLIIISLTNSSAYYKLLFKKKAKQLEKEHRDHLFNFNPEEIKKILSDAGFEEIMIKSVNYLRMPYFAEEITGKFPEKTVFALLDITDAAGRMFMNGKGGSFIVSGRKPEK